MWPKVGGTATLKIRHGGLGDKLVVTEIETGGIRNVVSSCSGSLEDVKGADTS